MNKRDVGLILVGVGAGVISNAIPPGPQIAVWPPPLDWVSVVVGLAIIGVGWMLTGKK